MTALSLTQPYKVNHTDVTIQSSGEKPDNQISAWGGRSVRSVKHCIETIASRSICTAQKVLSLTGSVVSDPNALAGIFRRLNCQVIYALEEMKKIPTGCFSKLRAASHHFVGAVDAVQAADDLKYFYEGEYKEDSTLNVGRHTAIFAANVGGTLLWLEEMSFISLSRAAKAIGEVRLFSFVPKVIASIPLTKHVPGLQHAAASLGKVRLFSGFNRLSMGLFAGSALTLYYLFSALESLKRIIKDGAASDKTQARLDLSYYASELTLNAMLIAGLGSVGGFGVLGATCIATGLASFAHKNYK
jgi:hypothetical protein